MNWLLSDWMCIELNLYIESSENTPERTHKVAAIYTCVRAHTHTQKRIYLLRFQMHFADLRLRACAAELPRLFPNARCAVLRAEYSWSTNNINCAKSNGIA